MKKGIKRIIAEVDIDLHTWAKIHCVRLGISMSEWLALVITEIRKEVEDKK